MKLEKNAVLPLIVAALKEDVGSKDLTTAALIPPQRQAKAELVVREDGVVAGLPVAEWTFAQVDPRIRFRPTVQDGDAVHPDKVVVFLEGPARGILTAERVALNFVGRLSGIASLTRQFVDKVKPRQVEILDTRKTTPGLRLLEKYAAACGGGTPHRMGLFDQVLIKENHLRLVEKGQSPSAIEQAIGLARQKSPKGITVEIEVTNLKEFRQALAAGPEIILLDNMKLVDIAEAVRIRNAVVRSKKEPKILLEISGGVTLENVGPLAATGVERISIGALTHSAPALNVALEVVG
ncbi:MAG: carboxylating nicotinate-nucleotide diphosphorylase [Candidatus Omnitrophica bacterium]|nr:carboxylating nicotinate-nucleotide diphosphorylase [Candidatus Omnitrophota bacterium]